MIAANDTVLPGAPGVECSALLAAVVMEHWMQGGTGLTNFKKPDREIYQKAIEAYGDPEILIVDEPIPGQGGYWSPTMKETSHSLHHVGRRKDLSGFWRTFESVRAANAPGERPEAKC